MNEIARPRLQPGLYPRCFLAVVPLGVFVSASYPKRLLLMFDKLAIDLAPAGMRPSDREAIGKAMPEIRHLINDDMATILSGLTASQSHTPSASELRHARNTMITGRVARERLNAAALREKGFDAVALTELTAPSSVDSPASRVSVIRIVLDEFPEPSQSTRWEDVKAFRNDSTARDKYWRLKNWINNAARKGLKEYEVADELRELLASYRSQMEIHKMKAVRSKLEVIVTTTADIAENLIKLKVGEAAKGLFGAFKEKIELLSEESKAHGKEVAYIYTANRHFGGTQ